MKMKEISESNKIINIERKELLKKQREFVLFIATKSNYFFRPRTIYQMAVDFSKEYSFEISAERISHILKKLVADGLLKSHVVPYHYGFGKQVIIRVFVYYHPDLNYNDNLKQIAGYKWMPTYIL